MSDLIMTCAEQQTNPITFLLADLGLPGAQSELVRRLAGTGKPIVLVLLAGRPLTVSDLLGDVDALLMAWHPGTEAGPALADLLLGHASPSGRLPVSVKASVCTIVREMVTNAMQENQ